MDSWIHGFNRSMGEPTNCWQANHVPNNFFHDWRFGATGVYLIRYGTYSHRAPHATHRTPHTAHLTVTTHTSSHLCFTPPDSSQCPARHNETSHDTVITVSVFVSWQDPRLAFISIPFPFIHNFEPSMGTWLGTRIGVWDS